MADSHGVVHRLHLICESSFILQSTGRESKPFLYTLLASRGPHLSPRFLAASLPVFFLSKSLISQLTHELLPMNQHRSVSQAASLCVWPNVPSHPKLADQRDIHALWPLKDIPNGIIMLHLSNSDCFLNMIHIILSKSIHWFHCQMIIDRVLKSLSLPRILLTYTQCPILIINSAAFSS